MKLPRVIATLGGGVGTMLGFTPHLNSQSTGQIEGLVRSSHIIFVGRVEQPHAAQSAIPFRGVNVTVILEPQPAREHGVRDLG
jgi:hypothetical protein